MIQLFIKTQKEKESHVIYFIKSDSYLFTEAKTYLHIQVMITQDDFMDQEDEE